MNTSKSKLFCLSLIILFTACNEDTPLEDVNTGINPFDTNVYVDGHINGLIVDENQTPLTNATVHLSSEMTTTDENGFFNFRDVTVHEKGSLIKVSKEGYWDGFKFAFLEGGKNGIIKIQLVQEKTIGQISADMGGTIDIPGGARVIIPQNAVALNGLAYDDNIIVKGHYYDPSSIRDLGETMPGDLRGINTSGAVQQLISYGMVAIELFSESGQELTIKKDNTATIYFPVHSSETPESIPLWYLDESTGIWREEGTAVKEGDFMKGEVKHFSFWNCDDPFDLVEIRGRLVDRRGNPISSNLVIILDVNANVAGTGYTNEDGVFSGLVPAGRPLILSFTNCIEDGLKIESLNSDIDLGDMELDDAYVYSISGQLLDCDGNLSEDAYLLTRTEDNTALYLSEGGHIDEVFMGCEEHTINYMGVDLETRVNSPFFSHDYTTHAHDFGGLELCLESDFISFTFNDLYILEDAEVTIINDTHLCIYADDEINRVRMKAAFPFDQNNFKAKIYFVSSNSSNSLGSNTFLVELESGPVSKVGDVVIGSILDLNGSVISSFRLKVDSKVTTASIKLKAWYDINENGLQDDNEDGLRNIGVHLLSENFSIPFASYFESFNSLFVLDNFTDEEGYLYVDGVITEEPCYLVYSSFNKEIPVVANAGQDDTLDSDFEEYATDKYRSHTFILQPGDVETTIDIGLVPE